MDNKLPFSNYFIGETDDLNWGYIDTIPELNRLKVCEQSMKWHQEGNAYVHTKRVVSEMCYRLRSKNRYDGFNTLKKRILKMSALFHDIGKGVTTKFSDGDWHSYNHAIEGAKVARKILWNEPIMYREKVCALVRWHMQPLYIFKGDDYCEKLIKLSYNIDSIKDLILLKRCDIDGSIPDDKNVNPNCHEELDYVVKLAESFGCLEVPFKLFDFDDTRHIIFKGDKPWLGVKTDKPKIYVMIGLPGAGKDTYISENLSGVVLCRDDIRAELGFCKEGEKIIGTNEQENRVTEVFNSRFKNAFENKQDIIINNINLRLKYRNDYRNIVKVYSSVEYEWHYIYIEAPTLETNLERRGNPFTLDLFSKMICSFDWPTPDEYDYFEIKKQ